MNIIISFIIALKIINTYTTSLHRFDYNEGYGSEKKLALSLDSEEIKYLEIENKFYPHCC